MKTDEEVLVISPLRKEIELLIEDESLLNVFLNRLLSNRNIASESEARLLFEEIGAENIETYFSENRSISMLFIEGNFYPSVGAAITISASRSFGNMPKQPENCSPP